VLTSLLAALKAVPKILDALERLVDVGTAIAAQNRKEGKDEMVDDLIARAISNRVYKDKVKRVDESGGDESGGV
jgi:hypothetical protein